MFTVMATATNSLDRRNYADADGMESMWNDQPERESRCGGNNWWIRDDDELTGDDVPKPMGKVGF